MKPDEIARYLLAARVELTGFYRTVIIDCHLAEDVFQDVCVKAIQSAETFNDETHLRRWCHTVGKNRAIDLLRKKDRKQILLGEEVLAKLEEDENRSADPVGTTGGGLRDDLEALGQCLSQLTPRSQKIVALRYGEDLSGIEVAQRMDCKIDTLYKALARIYQNLRECIRAQKQSRRKGGASA